MKFDELDIPEAVLKGIKAAGFSECTPVQAATLPDALKGIDVAAQSQTGTGKTAAFLIAIFSRMLERQSAKPGLSPRCLVIAPTRELVSQIHAEALILGQFADLKIIPVFGGMDYNKQRTALKQGADMVIGTPGRLIDYLKQEIYSLKKTEFLVIDEADRMFDMGFIKDLRFLLRRMSPYTKRQSMLFSATLSYRVMELCYEYMNLPEKVSITPEQITVKKVRQELYHVGMSEKPGLLLGILRNEGAARVLIFANMKVTAERLERLLKANGIKAAAITGDIPQMKRTEILSLFKAGNLPVLVASDVASRGLHIDGVTHVINYDLPQDSEDYVHRIGRTARAGAEGKAISFACEQYVYALEDIEKYIKEKIPVVPVEDRLVVKDYKHPSSLPHSKKRVYPSSGQPSKRTSGERPQRRRGGSTGSNKSRRQN
ncbi:MAG: DEAD/DEAH box helicase [Nitrospirae bacterium]|nr:DEAD/DEAH box helicase [Nitrospirota bacterium]